MYCHLVWKITFIFCLVYHIEMTNIGHRKKRSHSDNFNVLLSLYKMSPLKKSNLYKKFSDLILLPSRVAEQNHALHFDSNESVRENRTRIGKNLKYIEDVIHATNAPKKYTGEQYYSVENKGPEFFSEDFKNNYIYKDDRTQDSYDAQFQNILEHIGSKEIDTPNTKLVPVNVSLSKSKEYNKKPRPENNFFENFSFNKEISKYVGIKNHIPEVTTMRMDKLKSNGLKNNIIGNIDARKGKLNINKLEHDIFDSAGVNKDSNGIGEEAVIIMR